MWTNKGTWLGLGILALNPLCALLVLFYAIRGNYPWWMVTPDDLDSPFGKSEAAVVAVYAKWGRWCGDVYWLAFRNCLYGLAYRLKDDKLRGRTFYGSWQPMTREGDGTGFKTVYSVAGLKQWVYNIGPMAVIAGWKIKGVFADPMTTRKLVNMEFTPVFSIRLRKNA